MTFEEKCIDLETVLFITLYSILKKNRTVISRKPNLIPGSPLFPVGPKGPSSPFSPGSPFVPGSPVAPGVPVWPGSPAVPGSPVYVFHEYNLCMY